MELVFPPPEEPSILALPLPHPEAYEGEPREYALALMQRRDAIQKEIDVLTDILTSHGTTRSTSLEDNEGFPRGDIDIYAIRHARSSLVRLETDRRTVNELLANALNDAFAPGSSAQPNGDATTSAPQPRAQPAEVWPDKAVVKVNSVAEGSPAAEATALPLLVLRGQDQIRLSLTPRNGWGGRGSLGCHILPV
ncbi:hypothetical protein IAR50_002034 [Cryptococcus sp. DSM 104548]